MTGNIRKLHTLGKQLLTEAVEYEKPVTVHLPESDVDDAIYLLNVLEEFIYQSQYFADGIWVNSRAEGHRFVLLIPSFALREVIAGRYPKEYVFQAVQKNLIDAEFPLDQEIFVKYQDYWTQKKETAQLLYDLFDLIKERL